MQICPGATPASVLLQNRAFVDAGGGWGGEVVQGTGRLHQGHGEAGGNITSPPVPPEPIQALNPVALSLNTTERPSE